jgi:hypothetical protein
VSRIILDEYYARAGSRYTQADAQVIGPVLSRISRTTSLTAENVVAEARCENSELHQYFEWDDAIAADEHRKWQARQMIASITVRVEPTRTPTAPRAEARVEYVRPFINIRDGQESKYESIEVIANDPIKVDHVMQDARRGLESWTRKYRVYLETFTEFESVFTGVFQAIEAIQESASSEE